MFAKTRAVDGVPQVGIVRLYEAKSLSPIEAVAYTKDEVEGDSLTEIEYLEFWNAGQVFMDKKYIKADGLDSVIITAQVSPKLSKITFYHADTGEAIVAVPVDPATHTAILQVTATTPGTIRIRAGEPTATKLNEVTIYAIEAS